MEAEFPILTTHYLTEAEIKEAETGFCEGSPECWSAAEANW